jgi:ribonuclease H / adenosylcobalamin/alpha-ribazole phosphatase
MNGTRLILVRHAEPHEEVRDRIYGRLDPELSERGRGHAAAIAAELAGEPIAAVYTSPRLRAQATAAPLAARLGLEARVEDDLREIDFGELEGLTLAEAVERYPDESRWMTAPAGARFPGGESVAALRARAVAAAGVIAARHEGETAAVFSHAVVIRAILADALAMAPDAMFRLDQSYGGISVVEWFDGNRFVRVVNAVRL